MITLQKPDGTETMNVMLDYLIISTQTTEKKQNLPP
jgi:hypothetical protein